MPYFAREAHLKALFPEGELPRTIIITFQRAVTPTDKKMVVTETTKERCLENLMRIAQAQDEKFAAEHGPDAMLDWVDPSTGLMMKGENSAM